MSKFFKKAFKDISTMAEKATIPSLKADRDELEAERNNLIEEIAKQRTNAAELSPVLESIRRNREANIQTIQEIQAYFQKHNYIALPERAQVLVPLEEDQKGLKQCRDMNLMYISLVEMNKTFDETIEAYADDVILEMEARVSELQKQIAKYNERLAAIRSK